MKTITYILTLNMLFMGQLAYAQEAWQREDVVPKDIPILETNYEPEEGSVVIDGRPEDSFKYSHILGAINIMEEKFEDFLVKLVDPHTPYFIVADEPERLSTLVEKAESVGYGDNIQGVFLYNRTDGERMDQFRYDLFIQKPKKYTIVDIRTKEEHLANPAFKQAINIPLTELHDRIGEIPTKKPIIVHCASGYRSAIGSSILHHLMPKSQILDMGSRIKDFIE
ncbi:MAG TPA: rhodanese-like domain-containing protein [Anditalea sp.]|nr:rhodanese-like domain-containing protein [Anditalea sp.]